MAAALADLGRQTVALVEAAGAAELSGRAAAPRPLAAAQWRVLSVVGSLLVAMSPPPAAASEVARARSKLERARRLCNARFERGGSLGLGGGGPVTRNAAVPVEGELWTAFVAALRVNRAAEFAAEDALLLDALGRGTLESEGWLEGVVGGVVDAGLDAAAAVGDVAAEAAAAVGDVAVQLFDGPSLHRQASQLSELSQHRRHHRHDIAGGGGEAPAELPSTSPLSCARWSTSPSLRTCARRRTRPPKRRAADGAADGAADDGRAEPLVELRRDEGAVSNFTHIRTALSALVLYLSDSNCCGGAATRGAATSPAAAPSVSRCCCWATSATAPPSAPASPSGSPSSAAAAPTSNVAARAAPRARA